jgi:hypothetical protein
VSTGRSFFEQVRELRDRLRAQTAALDYVVEANERAEDQPSNSGARAGGGMVLDPVDPTRVVVPLVWLRALLSTERVEGFKIVADSAEARALLEHWSAEFQPSSRRDGFDRLNAAFPELATRVAAFLATL